MKLGRRIKWIIFGLKLTLVIVYYVMLLETQLPLLLGLLLKHFSNHKLCQIYHHFTDQLNTFEKGSLLMIENIETKHNIDDNLVECGHPVSNIDLKRSILTSLGISYQHFKYAYKLICDSLNLDDVIKTILEEESEIIVYHKGMLLTPPPTVNLP